MRDIKFRAWNKEMGIMDYGNELTGYNEFDCSPLRAVNDIINQNYPELVWMQCTGLKDIKGKEIYEGDIVLFEDVAESYTDCGYEYDEIKITGKVESTKFGFDITNRNSDLEEILECEIEVIGNIYENPELLEV